MAYSAEVIRRAQERLARTKEDRESENRSKLEKAYEKVPALRELDRKLQGNMAKVAAAVFSGGGDLQQMMAKAKEVSLQLQAQRQELIDANFGPGWLKEAGVCTYCGGHGYVGSTMCSCLKALCREEQKKELALLSGGQEDFSRFHLDYYSDRTDSRYGASPRTIMERNFKSCQRYAQSFTMDSGNLLFIGGTGLGKTFLSACIANEVTDRDYWVVYETAPRLFENLEQAKFSGSEEARQTAGKYKKCDLLIVDDLGTEMPGQFVTAALYSLLNDRLMGKLPMVISTNLNVDEASRRYSPQIASRLHGNFTRLTFVGEDIRVLRNRGC